MHKRATARQHPIKKATTSLCGAWGRAPLGDGNCESNFLVKNKATTSLSEGSIAGLCPAERRGLGQSPIKRKRKRLGLTISLVLYVFVTMLIAMLLALALFTIGDRLGLIHFFREIHPLVEPDITIHPGVQFLGYMIVTSTLIGIAIAAALSKVVINPIRKVIRATRKVSEGDFSVTVESKGINELEELAESFNKMTQELSSIETLRSDFIGNVSHEFRTPIVSIRGFAKLLKDANTTLEEREEYLEIIISESERLANLSANILNLSKYETIEIINENTKKPFRLDEQLRRVIVLTEPKWAIKEINIDIQLEEVVYVGNADLIQQIWLNLLDNAIKFSHNGGNIGVSLINLESTVLVTIQDDGVGMNNEVRRHIFDKFYQGDKSHSQEGNGLGLAMVKRIIKLCSGKVEVKSNLGLGSVFTVTLPK